VEVEVCPTPVIPALWRLRQKDGEFKDSLGYMTRPCLIKPKKKSKHEKQDRV
jgi:hypothetical protein